MTDGGELNPEPPSAKLTVLIVLVVFAVAAAILPRYSNVASPLVAVEDVWDGALVPNVPATVTS